jgi:CRISPR-associated endonuclease/helicase Cas3
MLQRMGRLHRHERRLRPIERAQLLVRWPLEGDDGPHFDPGTTAVYDEHILLRTWHVLRARAHIEVPQDIEALVEAVYAPSSEGEVVVPPELLPAVEGRWRDTWRVMRSRQEKEEALAKDSRLATPTYPKRPSRLLAHPLEEEEPGVSPHLAAVTRLAEPSVDVVILRPEDSPLSEHLRDAPPGQRLPLWLVRELLRRSIAVSARRLYRELVRLPVPPAFAATPGLRRARVISVDERGSFPELAIRLDPELGLVFEVDDGDWNVTG